MIHKKSKIIGAIEIGTAKVSVLIGEITNGRSLNIIGMGSCSSGGVIKGDVVDFKAASDCTHAAILSAEEQAGVRIEGVYLAQTGAHLSGFYNEAGVTVSSADNRVDFDDIERVKSLAKAKQVTEDRTVIHHIRRPFRLDGRIEQNPEYMEGKKLEVGYWTVHGQASKVSDHIHIVNGFSLHVDDIILSSIASGVIMSSPEERAHGTLVVDLGRGTTDYALYYDGHCYVAGVIPIGGDHFTNDLSVGLRLTTNQAESLKVRSGKAMVKAQDKTEKTWLNGDLGIGDRQVSQKAIEQILSARASELFEILKKSLGNHLRPELLGSGIVLTGGSSRLPLIDEVSSQVMGASTRIGECPRWVMEELAVPEFSTVLGLLNYGLSYHGEVSEKTQRSRGLFGRVKQIFATA